MKTKTKRGGRKTPPKPPFFNDSVSIRLTGAGDLIDVRYRVTPDMMTPGPIFIKDESTGKIATILSVPRIGKLMTRTSTVKNFGYGIFLNPGDCIKSGSSVTLVVGGFKREHIIVT